MKKIIITLGIVVGIMALGFYLYTQYANKTTSSSDTATSTTPLEDPSIVTSDYFKRYLAAALSTTTNPKDSGLFSEEILSESLRGTLAAAYDKTDKDRDPVLCQTANPERTGTKLIFADNNKAQVIVFARGFETKSPYQSVVELHAATSTWQIINITCVQGEVAPVKEFDFISEGYILKSDVAQLDPTRWYLVYKNEGVDGHKLPLFFSDESICVSQEGNEAVCIPDSLTNPSKVYLKADMSEEGALVKRLEILSAFTPD